MPESQGQNLALTVLYVPYTLDSGTTSESLDNQEIDCTELTCLLGGGGGKGSHLNRPSPPEILEACLAVRHPEVLHLACLL